MIIRTLTNVSSQIQYFLQYGAKNAKLLTPCVLQTLNCVGHDTDTAQESSTLLLVYFLVVPHTDCNTITFTNVTAIK